MNIYYDLYLQLHWARVEKLYGDKDARELVVEPTEYVQYITYDSSFCGLLQGELNRLHIADFFSRVDWLSTGRNHCLDSRRLYPGVWRGTTTSQAQIANSAVAFTAEEGIPYETGLQYITSVISVISVINYPNRLA